MRSLTAATGNRFHAASNPPTGNEDGATLASEVLNELVFHADYSDRSWTVRGIRDAAAPPPSLEVLLARKGLGAVDWAPGSPLWNRDPRPDLWIT